MVTVGRVVSFRIALRLYGGSPGPFCRGAFLLSIAIANSVVARAAVFIFVFAAVAITVAVATAIDGFPVAPAAATPADTTHPWAVAHGGALLLLEASHCDGRNRERGVFGGPELGVSQPGKQRTPLLGRVLLFSKRAVKQHSVTIRPLIFFIQQCTTDTKQGGQSRGVQVRIVWRIVDLDCPP